MNMRQLEAFRAVFRAGSVSGGAALLHTSQPSLSRLIADLEASIGFALFTRGRRGMVPTIEGRLFHEAVEKSYLGMERLRDTARGIAECRDGEIAIGSIPSVAQSLVPRALTGLRDASSNRRIHISVGTAPTLINAVLLNDIHIAVVGATVTLQDVETVFKIEFDGVCLIPEGHPLAGSEAPVDIMEMDAGSFVSYDRQLLEVMRYAPSVIDHIVANAAVTSNSTPTLVAVSRALSKPAIVEQLAIKTTGLTEGLVARKILQTSRHGLALVKRPDRVLPPPAQQFATAFQNIVTRLFEGEPT
ncbi:MAG: LysR family transcriptional regulator [Alphaproteobacteria bacterium]